MNQEQYFHLYKHSDQYYYGIGIKKLKVSEPDTKEDPPYFETIWDCRIWKEGNKDPIWQNELNEQWDCIPSFIKVMTCYLQFQNEFAIGFSLYNTSVSEKRLTKELGI